MAFEEDFLMHYGVGKLDGSPGRGSGRYPLGSGKNPHQHSGDLISRVEELRKSGMSDTEIAKSLKLSTTQFRVQIAIANEERRSANVATARRILVLVRNDLPGYPELNSTRPFTDCSLKAIRFMADP